MQATKEPRRKARREASEVQDGKQVNTKEIRQVWMKEGKLQIARMYGTKKSKKQIKKSNCKQIAKEAQCLRVTKQESNQAKANKASGSIRKLESKHFA